MPKTIVLSLGGSLIVPQDVDTVFLKRFVSVIHKYVKKGFRFAIICGGGSTARTYQQAASHISELDNESLDWIGIEATKLNAFLVKSLFSNHVEDAIIYDPSKPISFKKPIIVASGWKPGWSTDYDAVLIATQLKASLVINMSNIKKVYTADPKKNKNAKPLDSLSWKEYRLMVGDKWAPGMNTPFDPIAAKVAEKFNVNVHIIGKDLGNFENLLLGKKWVGTIIS